MGFSPKLLALKSTVVKETLVAIVVILKSLTAVPILIPAVLVIVAVHWITLLEHVCLKLTPRPLAEAHYNT